MAVSSPWCSLHVTGPRLRPLPAVFYRRRVIVAFSFLCSVCIMVLQSRNYLIHLTHILLHVCPSLCACQMCEACVCLEDWRDPLVEAS